MFRIRLSILLLLLFIQASFCQKKYPFEVAKLNVIWKLQDNQYKGQPKSLSAFMLTNKSNQVFPASGWSIYFQSIKTIDLGSVTGNVKMEHLNGTLYRITPNSSFKAIAARAKIDISFVTHAPIINYTDQPAGLYLIWDRDKDHYDKITDYEVAPMENLVTSMNSSDLFDQNEMITKAPVSKIIPTPSKYVEFNGNFLLTGDMSISYDPSFIREANYLTEELAVLLGKRLKLVSANTGQIKLERTNSVGKEAYQLTITQEGITISAADGAGIFYGIQSLKAVLPTDSWAKKQNSLTFPIINVEDQPRFGYRGLLLDVARGFKTKATVLKLLDLMAFYKLNVFHFHLNDDEGWRLEIPSLPELTEVGGKRGHATTVASMLPPAFTSGPDPADGLNSGYYTKQDFIEILKYAQVRHIQVIPEIETPGHARAAIKAMDVRYDRMMKLGKKDEALKYLLRDQQDSSIYSSAQRFNDNVMCVALPSVYTFIEKVVDDILVMYKEAGVTVSTIHFGGDEVPKGAWEKSPISQNLIENNPDLKETNDLWYYFFSKLNKIVKSKGLTLSGWEEVAMRNTTLDGKKKMIANPQFANEGFQIDVWNNFIGGGMEDLLYRLANAGYKVVLSCASNFYFDLAYHKSLAEPGHYWAGFLDVDKPFYFIPFDYYKNAKVDYKGNAIPPGLFNGKDRLTEYGKSNILGLKGLIWTEKIHDNDVLEYHLLPKMIGLAERAWAKDPEWAVEKDPVKSMQHYQRSWSAFVHSLGSRDLPRLDNYLGGFHYRIPMVGAKMKENRVIANIQLPGLKITYTTNNSEPKITDQEYTKPIATKGIITLRAFDTKGRGGLSTKIENK
ncbi:family 20 glycosylhydrolase [Pedobacter sp.]